MDNGLREILACPSCRSRLAFTDTCIECNHCLQRWSQTRAGVTDLLPSEFAQDEGRASGWRDRQSRMFRWYSALLDDPESAAQSFEQDFEGLVGHLATLRGRVLDLGGGI